MLDVYRDNELKATVNSWQELYAYIQRQVPYSLQWAVKYEGWTVIERKTEKEVN